MFYIILRIYRHLLIYRSRQLKLCNEIHINKNWSMITKKLDIIKIQKKNHKSNILPIWNKIIWITDILILIYKKSC